MFRVCPLCPPCLEQGSGRSGRAATVVSLNIPENGGSGSTQRCYPGPRPGPYISTQVEEQSSEPVGDMLSIKLRPRGNRLDALQSHFVEVTEPPGSRGAGGLPTGLGPCALQREGRAEPKANHLGAGSCTGEGDTGALRVWTWRLGAPGQLWAQDTPYCLSPFVTCQKLRATLKKTKKRLPIGTGRELGRGGCFIDFPLIAVIKNM